MIDEVREEQKINYEEKSFLNEKLKILFLITLIFLAIVFVILELLLI